MASVSSLGVGSGLDLQTLVDGLVASEQQVRLGGLDVREAIATERISAYGLLKSAVSLFDSSLTSLGDIATFQARTASSSDNEAFTVSAALNAGLGSYSVDVIAAGQAQSLTSSSFVDVTNTAISSANIGIGGGTLEIQQAGGASFSVSIDSTASSLNDIAAAINSAAGNSGVEATVINADSGPVLVINASEVGKDNEITIIVDDIDGDDTNAQGLSQLTFDINDIAGSNLTQSAEALNAQISINSQTITSTSGNTFADVVSGVTVTALAETTETGTISIAKNTGQAVGAVNEFIASFNELVTSISDLGRGSTEEGAGAGILVGDSVLRTLSSQLRRSIFTSVDLTQPLGVRTLSDLGISIDRDGQLALDTEQFNALLESNFDDVARLLAADGNAIAQNQQLQSVNFDTVSTAVGEGQLAITVGEDSFTVDISVGAANNTVQGIRDAINAAVDNIGVTASIVLVEDGLGGTDAQLILTADDAGDDGAITIAVTDNDGNDTDVSGLSQLASDNLTVLTASQLDASEGVILRLQAVVDDFLGGNGEQGIIDTRTEGLNTEVERIGDERLQQQTRLLAFQDRLTAQYASLDLLVANLQSNGNFLLSQLNSIAQISNSTNSDN